MPFLALASGTVHYQDIGEGVPLVLLHANPGDLQDYAAIIPTLATQFRVLALDWPGYGQSTLNTPPEQASAMLFHRVLSDFIDALKLPPVLLIGNSLGGNAALRLAIETPDRVRGLVLVSPGGFTPHNVLTRLFCRWQGSRFALSPRFFARLYVRLSTATTKAMLVRAGNEQMTRARLALNQAVWRSFIDKDHDLRSPAGRMTVKTLLIFGQYDPVIPARKDGREAQRCMPHAKFLTLKTGHVPFAELPDVFLHEVMPFLARC